jgi:hypothetical protein
MAEFKKLSEVEIVESPADNANVLIEEEGVIKKVAKSAVGGGMPKVYEINSMGMYACNADMELISFDEFFNLCIAYAYSGMDGVPIPSAIFKCQDYLFAPSMANAMYGDTADEDSGSLTFQWFYWHEELNVFDVSQLTISCVRGGEYQVETKRGYTSTTSYD